MQSANGLPERIPRADWLRSEIDYAIETIERLTPSARHDAVARARVINAERTRDEALSALTDLSRSAVDIAMSGGSVVGDAIEAGVLSTLLRPLDEVVEALGGSAFVSPARSGSYAFTVLPDPDLGEQLALDHESPIDKLGAVLSEMSSGEVGTVARRLGEDLDPASFRSMRSWTHAVVKAKVRMRVTWRSYAGRREVVLEPERLSDLQRALDDEVLTERIVEVSGVLTSGSIDRRPFFRIRGDDGHEYSGAVPRGIAREQFDRAKIGQRVAAKLEMIVHNGVSSQGRVSYRLASLEPV
jgi:hypothetical protein